MGKNRKGVVRSVKDSREEVGITFLIMPARGKRYSFMTHRLDGGINVTQFPYGKLESHLESALRRIERETRVDIAYRSEDLTRTDRRVMEVIQDRYGFARDGFYRGNGYEATRYVARIRIINKEKLR